MDIKEERWIRLRWFLRTDFRWNWNKDESHLHRKTDILPSERKRHWHYHVNHPKKRAFCPHNSCLSAKLVYFSCFTMIYVLRKDVAFKGLVERVFAAIPAIYSGGHTGYPSEAWVELGRGNYTINIFHTDEETRRLRRGSSICISVIMLRTDTVSWHKENKEVK